MRFDHMSFLSSKLTAAVTLIACCLITTGCDRAQSQQKPAQMPTPEVTYITVQPEELVLTTELPGRTCAYVMAEIRPQVNGIVQKRLFKEGSEVKAGQVLYQIDPAPFQASLDNAKASLSRSEANRPALKGRTERYKELLADKAVSRQDYDDATAALRQAEADAEFYKAAVETARISLGYTKVTAPISGRIGRSSVTDGALVTAHQPVALSTIQQLNPIYVDVPQSTADLLRLRRRMESGNLQQNGKSQKNVQLFLEDGSIYSHEGELQFRDVTVDPNTGTVNLRAVFPNPDGLLLPGMFVRAVVKEGTNQQAIMIPQQSVSRDPKGNPQVLIVDGEEKSAVRAIVVDRAIGDKWLVTDGLHSGDRVIMEGMLKARPGTPVKAVPLAVPPKKDVQPAKSPQHPADAE